jgi:hypothetical protein
MAYLYAEVSPADKTRLTAHLGDCDYCRGEVGRWQNAREALDWGKTAGPRKRACLPQPLLKWGIAAALTLAVGFSAGRFAPPAGANTPALRASLKSELRSELLAELKQSQERDLAAWQLSAEEKRAEDDKLILAAIRRIDADRQADYASLHKELETVAVLTQASLQNTQQQIVTLASYSLPNDKPSN